MPGTTLQERPSTKPAIEDARAAWPGVVVPEDEFTEYLSARATEEDDPARVRVRDLYLACACARGDPEAIATLDRMFLAPLAASMVRRGAPPHVGAEVTQTLRTRLLAGASPAIADYAGRGGLARWLRISAMREVTKVYRHERAHQRLRPDAEAPALTPEEASIRARYGGVFTEAFREAFQALGTEERLILRLHFAEGLNLDGVAGALGFSRATAGRRIMAARATLRDEVLRRVGANLGASPAEAESVLAALGSALEITLGALVSAA